MKEIVKSLIALGLKDLGPKDLMETRITPNYLEILITYDDWERGKITQEMADKIREYEEKELIRESTTHENGIQLKVSLYFNTGN